MEVFKHWCVRGCVSAWMHWCKALAGKLKWFSTCRKDVVGRSRTMHFVSSSAEFGRFRLATHVNCPPRVDWEILLTGRTHWLVFNDRTSYSCSSVYVLNRPNLVYGWLVGWLVLVAAQTPLLARRATLGRFVLSVTWLPSSLGELSEQQGTRQQNNSSVTQLCSPPQLNCELWR